MTEITRITNKNIDEVSINAYPELLFEAVDLVKDICEKTNSDYSVLLSLVGLGDAKPAKKDDKSIEQTLGGLIINLALFLYNEYDRVNKKSGPALTKLIDILADATELEKEVLRKTDYRVLLKILAKFVQEPNQEMTSSFLGVNPSI